MRFEIIDEYNMATDECMVCETLEDLKIYCESYCVPMIIDFDNMTIQIFVLEDYI